MNPHCLEACYPVCADECYFECSRPEPAAPELLAPVVDPGRLRLAPGKADAGAP